MRWYQKWFSKNKKNIILIIFRVKNILKKNHRHTFKQMGMERKKITWEIYDILGDVSEDIWM
jgi:hypothetical protein